MSPAEIVLDALMRAIDMPPPPRPLVCRAALEIVRALSRAGAFTAEWDLLAIMDMLEDDR